MPLFTSIATAIFAGTALAGTWIVGATAFALQMAAGIGLNLIAAAIKGKPTQEKVGIQGKLTGGGDVPRSIILGRYNTAGSLVYRNTWGQDGDTPNANYVEVRTLADHALSGLVETWVDGEKVTLVPGDRGLTSQQHIKHDDKWGDIESLWIQFLDGTQTEANSYLAAQLSSSDRPWGSDRIGAGTAYVAIVARRDDTQTDNPIFNGFPQCKFTLQGMKLYDPSRDSSVGGSGSQRYSDPSTWGGDGDDFPAVQIYNILRGITVDGQWLFGLQAANPAILPPANWIAAINKCRTQVYGPDGLEAQYRSGIQVNVDVAPADAIEALLKTCNGRLTEVGGVYTIHVGEPDAPVLSFSDADILSTEEQVYNPFRALADSINGVVAKYPEPLEGWNVKTSPPTKNPAQIVRDGSRELFADVDLSACPYTGQIQRLLKSAMLEALRERRHTIVMPPWAQVLEPGDVIEWNSARNGYEEKWFRIDGMAYKANLDVMLQITEVDPSDYDWHQDTDYIPPVFAPMQIIRPAPQPMVSWNAEGMVETAPDGRRRVYVLLTWDRAKADINGVSYQISTAANEANVILRENSDDASRGSINVYSQGLLPGTTVYARGRYIPTSPRATDWSDWRPAVLPDVRWDILDFEAGVRYNVTDLENKNVAELQAVADAISERVAYIAARLEQDRQVQNEQSWDHRVELIDKIDLVQDEAESSIEEVRTIATNTQSSFAAYQITVSARFGTVESSVSTNATAISNAQTSIGNLNTTVYSSFGGAGIVAKVTSDSSTLASLGSSFASFQSSATASLNGLSSSVSAQGSAIANLNGVVGSQYAVTLTTNGYATGFNLINVGAGTSAFVIVADKFQIQLPGYNSSAPQPFFTTGTVNGIPAVGMRGNFYLDGTFNVRAINAGSINTVYLAINSVGIDQIIKNAVTNTVPFYFSSPGDVYTPDIAGYTPKTICSGVVNIQGGAATVRVCSFWAQNWFGSFTSDPGMLSCGFGLEVDGMLRRAFCYPMQFNKGYSQASIQQSFTEEFTVTGLSAGNHTFRIRALWLSATHGGPGNEYLLPNSTPSNAIMGDGQMFVTDFRR